MIIDKINHRDLQDNPTKEGKTLEQSREDILELNAKMEADGLRAFRPDGKPAHTFNEGLRGVFVNKNGIVNWQLTLEKRKEMVKEYEWLNEIGGRQHV